MAFEVSRARAAYPALADGYAYLDGTAVPNMANHGISESSGRKMQASTAT